MLEAMACGCLVIGADTAPVREVLRHGENGWLVDFFDDAAIAGRILTALDDQAAKSALRQQARKDIVNQYSLQQGLQGYNRLLGIASSEHNRQTSPALDIARHPKPNSQHPAPHLQTRQPIWKLLA
jgi:hypothetical protein